MSWYVRLTAVVSGVLACSAVVADCTDTQIREALLDGYRDEENLSEVDVGKLHALALCGADTNRLVRILKEMTVMGSSRDVMLMVQDIGEYGCADDIPFLSAMTSNSNAAATAVIAMMRLGGLTTNVTDCARAALQNPLVDRNEKLSACIKMWQLANMQGSSSQISTNAYAIVLSYISGSADNAGCVDRQLVKVDVGYKWSRRRLSALRAATGLTLHELHREYITNAINEMIAYPESALNE